VCPVLKDGGNCEDGRQKLLEMVNDSVISAITLQMQKPRSVALAWSKKV